MPPTNSRPIGRLRAAAGGALRLGERVFRTDLRYLIRGLTWLVLGPLLTTATSLALGAAYARCLSMAELGAYRGVMTYAAFLAAFSLSGMATSVTQAVARGHEEALREALRTSFCWGLVVGSVHLAVAGVLGMALGRTTLAWGLVVAGLVFPLSSSAPLYSAYLNGKRAFRGASMLPAYASVGTSLLLLLTLAIHPVPLTLAIVNLVGLAAFQTVFLWITLRLHRPAAGSGAGQGTTGYGTHLSVMDWLGSIAQHLDQVVALHYLGAPALAVYYLAGAIPEQIRAAVKSLHFLVLPKFAARSAAEIRAGILGKFLWLAVFTGAVAGAYALAAPTLYAVFFPGYEDSVGLSRIYVLQILNYVSLPAGTFLAAKRKVREQYAVNVSMSLLQIALTFALVVPWELAGLAWARVTRSILGAALIVFFFYRCSGPETGAAAAPRRGARRGRFVFFTKATRSAGSSRHRAFNVAAVLERAGEETRVLVPPAYRSDVGRVRARWDYLRAILSLRRRDVVVLQTTIFNRGFLVAMVVVRALLRPRIVFDFDDAIYLHSPGRTRTLVRISDGVTVASHHLAGWRGLSRRRVLVLPNLIDWPEVEAHVAEPESAGKPVLGWIGGAPRAMPDLALLVPVLGRLVERGVSFRFRLIGALGDPVVHEAFAHIPGLDAEVVDQIAWERPGAIPSAVASFDVGVCPLRDNEANQARCSLKVLDYMSVGIPVCISDVGENRWFVEHGTSGFLAATEDDWVEHLARLLGDPGLRGRVGREARERIRTRYTYQANVDGYRRFISGR